MPINRRVVNSRSVNSAALLASVGFGPMITLQQEVSLLETGFGSLITLEQNVVSEANSRPIITLVQLVTDTTQKTFLQRNGWYPVLTINGYRIPDDMIHGTITVTRVENDSASLKFTLIPDPGLVNLQQYEGANVTLDVYLISGASYRVYTGVVNIPDLDIINKKLIFNCNDNRREKINNQFGFQLPYIGYYTTEAFGEPEDDAEELDKRLQTTPLSVDFDGNGNAVVTPLLASSSPHFTLYNSDVYRDDGHDPQVFLTPRSRIVNQINIKASYQFQRLYHREVSYQWFAPYANNPCDFLSKDYSIPSREMIRQAVTAAGWPIRGEIAFTPVLAAGFYNCDGGTRGWSTGQTSYANKAATNPNGSPKLDAQGKQIFESVVTSVNDIGSTLAFGAEWNATKRWSQNLTEEYTLSVSSSQSIAQYGVISQDDNIGVASDFDSSEWENYTAYRGKPTNYNVTNSASGGYYFNADTNLSGWQKTCSLMIAKAMTTIIKAHRDTRVVFHRSIWPVIDLRYTVYLDCDRIQAQGKVRQVVHTMDVTTGEATTVCELALSRSIGSGTSSIPSIPARPTYAPNSAFQNRSISLDSHYGLDPDIYDPNNRWTGHIGNKYVVTQNGSFSTDTSRTKFPESFVVDTPSIEDAVRTNITIPASGTYETAIQVDLLEIYL